jgi:hypothetical protein
MATAPYGIRLLVGAATIAAEETKKLPQTILMYPMTLASQAAHMVMRWQQNLAELAIKGDATLELFFPPKDEHPEWAVFDEDLGDETPEAGAEPVADPDDGRIPAGRFALYSDGDHAERTETRLGAKRASPSKAPAPEVVTDLDYEALTLAQLRARLHSLRIDDLEALLAYEEATKARAPFQTLLANRITRATAK